MSTALTPWQRLLEDAVEMFQLMTPTGQLVYANACSRRVLGLEPAWIAAAQPLQSSSPQPSLSPPSLSPPSLVQATRLANVADSSTVPGLAEAMAAQDWMASCMPYNFLDWVEPTAQASFQQQLATVVASGQVDEVTLHLRLPRQPPADGSTGAPDLLEAPCFLRGQLCLAELPESSGLVWLRGELVSPKIEAEVEPVAIAPPDSAAHLAASPALPLAHSNSPMAEAEATVSSWSGPSFFAQVLNSIADPIFVRDAQHRWVFVNEAFCRFVGQPRQALLGKTEADIFSPEQAQSLWQRNELVLQQRGATSDEEPFTLPGQGLRMISTRRIRFQDDLGQVLLVGSIRDITERYLAEQIRLKRERHLGVLVDLQHLLLTETLELEAIYPRLLALLGQTADASRVSLFEHERCSEDRLIAIRRGEWCASGVLSLPEHFATLDYLERGVSAWIDPLSQGEMIHRLVAELPEAEQPWLAAQHVQAVLILPLMVAGKFYGFLRLDNCIQPGLWEGTLLNLLRGAAAALSLALEHRQVDRALLKSETRFQQIANTIPQAIVIESPQLDRTLYVSPRYTQLLGTPVSSLPPEPSRQAHSLWRTEPILPEDLPLVEGAIAHQVQGQGIHCEYRIRWPDGAVRWILAQTFPIFDGAGQLLHHIAIKEDISDRKQAEEDMLKTLNQEKELNELKSRFVSMISHEFRTPLTTIQSATELLQYYEWSAAEVQERYQQIQSAVQHMTQLLEDVLLLGRLEANRTQLRPHHFDLREFCHETFHDLHLTLGRQHQMQFIPSPQPCEVWLDSKLMRQILTNLLSNAVKYTPEGGRIEMQLEDQGDRLRIQVRDEGIGIPPQDRARLFEPFHRASNTDNIQGTGLGLAIVKSCVEIQAGQIELTSDLGQGTCFTITLPRCYPPLMGTPGLRVS